ncbi:hydantoinase/oxoprolinase family protein [Roseovarius salis]|uniref:hydantoinase/oxoprolinase family protein n=1 Tax=Roseovarius salis TaxID=3376063 RepID=UPI0037C510AC
MRVGIEVGGTFTDMVAVEDDRIELRKVPSTPAAPDRGVLNAIEESGVDCGQISDMVHGSTVATNALLERKGANVAFVTTAGFRDILFLQRHDRRNIYDLRYQRPVPVVERVDCFEVAERVDAQGEVLAPLDIEAVKRDVLPDLKKGGYDAVAICLLSSYANPAHEEALLDLLTAEMPEAVISVSSQVTREFREYERASTVTLAGYVQPVIDRYIERLEDSLQGLGVKARLSIMQSNGGRVPASAMRRNAIAALFSGPAAGVVGAIRQVGRSGNGNLITFDMGGTSADVCLVTGGRPGISPDTEIDGLPVRTPVIDISTVGAGGGSIVWIDDGGMLRVGPTSAGAEPGPACYGKGGTQPTLTDAHVIRGSLRPEAFLGGAMKIDRALAVAAFRPLAEQLGLSVPEAAGAALRLGAANIVRAIQHISTEQGKDPRDYALVPYGGAGPLLAAEIAEELGVQRVIVPPNPGVLSAYGLIASDFSRIYAATHRFVVDEAAADKVRAIKAEMEAEARADFETFALGGELEIGFVADMRFVGQAFEVPVELDEETLEKLDAAMLEDLFQQAHHRIFLHGGTEGQKIEMVSFRVTATRAIGSLPAFREKPSNVERPAHTSFETGQGVRHAALHSSSELPVGQPVKGLALIEGYSSTVYLPDGWTVTRDADDNLTMERSRA